MNDWLSSFYKVLVLPRPVTFSEITQDAPGKLQLGIVWISVSTLIVFALGYLAGGVSDLTVFVFSVIAFPIGIMLWASLANYIYRRFVSRKRQWFDEFYYALVCIYVPTTIINGLLVLIPGAAQIVNWLIPTYQIILAAIAIIGITKSKVLPAFTIALVSGLVAFISTILLIFFIPALMQGVRNTY